MDRKVILLGFLALLVSMVLVSGCQTKSLRLPAYVGQIEGFGEADGHRPQSLPTAMHRVGVMIITDSSFPRAAPALSPDMLAILENRLVKKMDEYFSIPVTRMRTETPIQPTGATRPFTELAKTHQLDFLLLAVLSSTEVESHIEIGEETMMTRMSGVEIENGAQAELALLHTDSEKISLHAVGEGSESMEQLAAPIGGDYPRKEDAKDILRANAAEKALDQALLSMQRQWGRSLVTGKI
ncbi:hypothetical protein [Candidatus Nitronereus thalassa]|uniref:Lipoprotein n=1 Tax=Candidatus Nitronereus thalassa TaxID=3020898 RepID=A0ABU3KAH3_9BACT|nr:hypothetical protein [Candidatus Nitronereus thalassa]MDT7043411.1 hypothetical protein [Candidatus Nitronereus thalassa]